MIRAFVDIILILICFLMQQTLFQALSLGGIVPNLLIILTATFGFLSGRREGMWIGFISGLIVDIFFGSIIGINAIIYALIGYSNGYYKGGFFPEDIKFPLLLIIISDAVFSILYYVSYFLLRGKNNIILYAKNIILPELLYTLIIAIIIYKPLLWIHKKTAIDTDEI